MQLRIDGSGNILVAPDTATTSSKLVTLYLVAALQAGGSTIAYHHDSVISDVQYDFSTYELSWVEQGRQGRQTVTVDNASLRKAIGLLHDHAQTPTASEIATAVSSAIDLSGLATLQAVADAKNEILSAIPSGVDLSGVATAEQITAVNNSITAIQESMIDGGVYAANEVAHSSHELEILDSVRELRGRYCKTFTGKTKEN